MNNSIIFDIKNIYTLAHKKENRNFYFHNPSRLWDGFILVTSGEMFLAIKKQPPVKAVANDIIFLNKGDIYTVTAKDCCSYYVSAYDFYSPENNLHQSLPRICHLDALKVRTIAELTDTWQRKLTESFITCKIELLKFYLGIITPLITKTGITKDRTINLAIDYIHLNFRRNFTAEEIADYCSISPSHLRLKFQKYTNMTITDYRDALRLKSAKEMLSSGFFTVKEAAFELGFCDVYYFTKFFKKATGTTPSKFSKDGFNI